jgi:hypothetical protein
MPYRATMPRKPSADGRGRGGADGKGVKAATAG